MPRSYVRLDPGFADRKRPYPDGPYRALIDVFCAAEYEPTRGQFRSMAILRAVIGKSARHLPYLFAKHDIALTADDRIQVVGWDEWQEGNWQVAERMRMVRDNRASRHGEAPADPTIPEDRTPGAARTANWRLRSKVFERDVYTCRYCAKADYPREWLVLEHVIPGGPATEENLVTACRPCNKIKGPRTPEQAGMIVLPVTRHGDTSRPSASDAPPSSEQVGGKPLAVSGRPLAATETAPVKDPYDAPEFRAVQWLVGRGCYLPETSGYYRWLIRVLSLAGDDIETLLVALGKASRAGVKDGDVKGFLTAAEELIRKRPDLKALEREERADDDRERFNRAVERTQREQARVRGGAA